MRESIISLMISTRQAAAMHGISAELLNYYCKKGKGPEHIWWSGRRVFLPKDVEAWTKPEPDNRGGWNRKYNNTTKTKKEK